MIQRHTVLLTLVAVAAFGSTRLGNQASPVLAAREAHTSAQVFAKSKSSNWRTFSSKALGVAFRYPSTWQLSKNAALSKSVLISGTGRTLYAVTVFRLGLTPGPSAQATLQRFIAYEGSAAHTNTYARAHWVSTSIGGHPASAGILRFATESALHTLADAIYVTQGHGHVYEILMAAYHRPSFSKLSQFPSVYRQILQSWRFI